MQCKTVLGAVFVLRSVDVSCAGFIVSARGQDLSICLLTVDFPAQRLPKEAAAHDKS